jgi:hypothetical protein
MRVGVVATIAASLASAEEHYAPPVATEALKTAIASGRPFETGPIQSESGAVDRSSGVKVEMMNPALGRNDRETGVMVWERTRLLLEIPIPEKSIKRIEVLSTEGTPLPLATDIDFARASRLGLDPMITWAEVWVQHSPGFIFRVRISPQ